jgi:BASS family bile acid:Na+ symporter
MKNSIITFIKNWTLPIAMVTGVIMYFTLAGFEVFAPVRHPVHVFVNNFCPILVFAQLFVTFCKINPRELIPSKWHIWLGLFQLLSSLAVAAVVIFLCKEANALRYGLEGIVVMLICPTATAAAVITGKLGGNAASLTTYTLISNIIAAITVPLVFPLMEPSDISFISAFSKMLGRAVLLLIAPFILAFILRMAWPRAQEAVARQKDLAFYLWAICLTCIIGVAAHVSVTCDVPATEQILTALAILVTCAALFVVGKKLGSRFGDRISCGQALGQKNTTLAIWMTYVYLNPFAVIGPGSYIVWQNIINSYQLYLKRKNKLRIN